VSVANNGSRAFQSSTPQRIVNDEGMRAVNGAGPANRHCGECLNLRESTSGSRPGEHARNHCHITLFTCLLVPGRVPWSTSYPACGRFAAERA
jgi:hypothetical protein